MSVFLSLLLGAIVVVLVWRLLRSDRQRKLVDKIPGPRSWPILGSISAYIHLRNGKDTFESSKVLANQYPIIYRIWFLHVPFIKILDPKYIEALLDSTTNITKSQEYDFTSDWLGRGILTSTGAKWHSRRKLLNPAFHFSILEQFVPVFCDKTRILVEKLRSAASANPDGVNIVPYVIRCALDIICQTAMGTSVNAQDDLNSPYVAALHEVNEILFRRFFTPWLYSNFLFRLSSWGRRQQKCLEILHGFTNKVIQERKAEKQKDETTENKDDEPQVLGLKKKIAFLDLLIEMQKQTGISDEDIREEVDTIMFAGHDTTAISTSWASFFLGCNPQVQEKCVQELEEIFGDSSRDPELSDLNNMKYLERVVKESLRLRPAVWSIGRRLEHDLPLDKYIIPSGVTCSPDIYNLHHNPKIYPDPEKFDPDRFSPENCVGRHPYAYLPFGAGLRNCIGQKFALLEMKVTLSTMLRHFKIHAVNPERDQNIFPDIVLRPQFGVTLQLIERK